MKSTEENFLYRVHQMLFQALLQSGECGWLTTSVGTAKAEISNQFIVLLVSRKLQYGMTTGT